jgi:DNA-binding PadR family transcriptional regulator
MSTRLVVLGLLRRRPLHGYEIKHIIQDHMGDWTSIAFGSIYFALGKLAEEGLVEVHSTEQEGSRPSRTVYAVTEAGRAEFLRLLRDVWSKPERQHFVTDLGLFFMDALSSKERLDFLDARVAQLEKIATHLTEHRAESLANPRVPRQARFIFDHSRAHLDAEIAWTRALREELLASGPADVQGKKDKGRDDGS